MLEIPDFLNNLFNLEINFKEDIFERLILTIIIGVLIYLLKKPLHAIVNLFKSRMRKFNFITIEGASVINKKFLNDIKLKGKKQKITVDDFYLSKQDEVCQWYGILNKWDVDRDAEERIKEALKESFIDEFRQPKIVAYIHGRGGSGKSTLLRRIAVDSIKEDYSVLWITNKDISRFYEKGIRSLVDYPKIKFLIIIEDWYKINQNTINSKEIIESICTYNNVRILIGDRSSGDSVIRENVFNPDENIIELKVNENEKIIPKILDNVYDWKETANILLNSNDILNSTLYLILWVIARTYQREQDKDTINKKNAKNIEGLTGHFQAIVESDLTNIAQYYLGLAKALFYYGKIYSEDRIYIGFETFLSIAHKFDEKKIDNRLAFTSEEVKPILDIYINRTSGLLKSTDDLLLVGFNHDILADEGLYKAQIKGWHRFDYSIRLQILPFIINEGDCHSASIYFYTTLSRVDKTDFPNKERLKYLDKLVFEKKNKGYYIDAIFNGFINIDESEKRRYGAEFLKDFLDYNYSHIAVAKCLRYFRHQVFAIKISEEILSQPKFYNLYHPIVLIALDSVNNKTAVEKSKEILSQPKFYNLSSSIVLKALDRVDTEIAEKKSKEILSQPKFYNLYSGIVLKALNRVNTEIAEKKSEEILSQPKFYNLSSSIVLKALDRVDTEIAIEKSKEILSQPHFYNLSSEIVLKALDRVDAEIAVEKSKEILSQHDFYNLSSEIVLKALNCVDAEIAVEKSEEMLSHLEFYKLPESIVLIALNNVNDEIARRKSEEILSQPDFHNLSPKLISTAIRISKNASKAEYFLRRNWEKTTWNIVYHSLFCFAEKNNYPQFIIDIVESIIASKTKGKPFDRNYKQTLGIPFHGVNRWDEECGEIINSYITHSRATSNTDLLNKVLFSHRSHPEKTIDVCRSILIHWSIEIEKPIKQIYGESHYGDNIKEAMGHPDLKLLAKNTAKEILEKESNHPRSIKKYLLDIAEKIVDEDKYPEWRINKNEDFFE